LTDAVLFTSVHKYELHLGVCHRVEAAAERLLMVAVAPLLLSPRDKRENYPKTQKSLTIKVPVPLISLNHLLNRVKYLKCRQIIIFVLFLISCRMLFTRAR